MAQDFSVRLLGEAEGYKFVIGQAASSQPLKVANNPSFVLDAILSIQTDLGIDTRAARFFFPSYDSEGCSEFLVMIPAV